jgi:hypothetical protein
MIKTFTKTHSIVQWTVPFSATYTIVAKGAQGCAKSGLTGGLGASMQGDFSLYAGQVLSILVGQQPCSVTTLYPGGGGGSFVGAMGADLTITTPLLVAGGGGGLSVGTAPSECGGQVTQLGSGPTDYQPNPGYGSLAAACGGGGGGFYTAGGMDRYNFPGGKGFSQGGEGAVPPATYAAFYTNGGFGGGGIANYVGDCWSQGGPGGNMNKSFITCNLKNIMPLILWRASANTCILSKVVTAAELALSLDMNCQATITAMVVALSMAALRRPTSLQSTKAMGKFISFVHLTEVCAQLITFVYCLLIISNIGIFVDLFLHFGCVRCLCTSFILLLLLINFFWLATTFAVPGSINFLIIYLSIFLSLPCIHVYGHTYYMVSNKDTHRHACVHKYRDVYINKSYIRTHIHTYI